MAASRHRIREGGDVMTSDLAQRMTAAADTIEEASAWYGYPVPEDVNWTAEMLRRRSGARQGGGDSVTVPVLRQRRPRSRSSMQWWRCARCNRLTYGPVMRTECELCTEAAERVYGLGPVCGEASGC